MRKLNYERNIVMRTVGILLIIAGFVWLGFYMAHPDVIRDDARVNPAVIVLKFAIALVPILIGFFLYSIKSQKEEDEDYKARKEATQNPD